MRIGINGRFLGARVTGVQRFAREVVPRLAGLADTALLVPRGVPVPADWPLHHAPVSGSLRGHAWEQLELPVRLREQGCDVCLSLSGTAPLRGGPHVMVMHDVLPLTDPQWFSPRFAAWYRLAAGRAARTAAMVVTVSEWSRSQIVDRLGIPPERVRVAFPQGVTPFDHPTPRAEIVRVLAAHDIEPPYVLALGGGDPRKNTAFVTEIARRWRATAGDAPSFVVVGESSRRVHGSTAVQNDGSVKRLGRVSDDTLRALYGGAAAFVFPSLAEGFGRPPLEALACGAPVVVSDYAAAREVLGDEALIAPLDVDAWIAAVQSAIANDDPARREARSARIAQRFRWEAAADALLDACLAAVRKPAVT